MFGDGDDDDDGMFGPGRFMGDEFNSDNIKREFEFAHIKALLQDPNIVMALTENGEVILFDRVMYSMNQLLIRSMNTIKENPNLKDDGKDNKKKE